MVKHSDKYKPARGQGSLFDDDTTLFEATKNTLFHKKTEWTLNFGTIPSIDLLEQNRRRNLGDIEVPVHDAVLSIALPLDVTHAGAVETVKKLIPDYDDKKDKLVVTRPDRFVQRPRFARGNEADWGKYTKEQGWKSGITIDIRDPARIAAFLDLAKQMPESFKIVTAYNDQWFEGVPPEHNPNAHFADILAQCSVDNRLLPKLEFTERSAFIHEAALRHHLESKTPTNSIGIGR